MKKLTVALFIVFIVGAMVLQGPAPASAKSMVLKWTTFEPDVPGSSQLSIKRFAKLVEEKTEGRVKIRVYWGSVLGKAPDFLKMIGGRGVADGGFLVTTYHQWEIPLVAAGGLPFLTTGYRTAPVAYEKLYREWPAMQEEMKKVNVKPLWFFQPHPHWLDLKDPIQTLEDLKGKKVWAAGFWQELADAYGIVNVPMIAPQAYDALQKGVIVGVFGNPYHTFRIFKYIEVAKFLVEWPFGGQPINMQGINMDVWREISPEDQKAIEEIAAGMNDWFVVEQDKEAVRLKEFFESQGCTHNRLSDAEYAEIREVGKKVIWSSWLKTAKANGVP
jgi:TRAP-type C4-dicarboxylate transport system substrate-binding protein